ncbi:MAG: hypothetical protein LC627_02435, partial [Verrucomicrobiaceae bacterium]|nr:hypothetical protein [Verrucomicrobiaceae bacterium]
MKTFLILAFSLTTALAQVASAQVASAEDQDEVRPPNKHSDAPVNRRTAVVQAPRVQPNATVRQQTPVYH